MLTCSRLALMTGIVFVVLSGPASAGAPQPLYDKSIQIAWTSSAVERSADGRTINPQINVGWTIYVSSAGRLFVRGQRSVRGRGGLHSDIAPGATTNRRGEPTGVRFVGKTLVGNVAYALGALHFVATFDQSFGGCTLQVVYGREGGKMMRRGIDGVSRQIVSVGVSGQTCSIHEGNAFAG